MTDNHRSITEEGVGFIMTKMTTKVENMFVQWKQKSMMKKSRHDLHIGRVY
jgi:hypothetical protein